MVELATRRFTAIFTLMILVLLQHHHHHFIVIVSSASGDDAVINYGAVPQQEKGMKTQQQKPKYTSSRDYYYYYTWKLKQDNEEAGDAAARRSSTFHPTKPAAASHHRVTTSAHKNKNKMRSTTTLQMKHRDWPSATGVKDRDMLYQQRLISDHKYVQSLQTRIRRFHTSNYEEQASGTSTTTTQIPLSSGRRLQLLNYVTTIQLGDQNLTLIVDTGSDLTWVQCAPCQACYTQQEPLFDPSSSSSYRPLPCSSTSCSTITGNAAFPSSSSSCTSTSQQPCSYYVSYGDGSYTSGEVSTDRLTMGTTTTILDRFVFGCGRSNRGLFGSAAGLLGLGRSTASLISQTRDVFHGVFSYCLPSSDSPSATGSLTFGDHHSPPSLAHHKHTPLISYTNMITLSSSPVLSSLYLLNLTGIALGGVNLPIPTKDGRIGSTNGAVLIDSGTVITRLPPSVYSSLRREFVNQFVGYPVVPGFSILDTCFDLSGFREVRLPKIEFIMEGGVVVTVDAGGVMYLVKGDASRACLAVASLQDEDELPIIGNYQQRDLRVVYDMERRRVGFAQERCG